MKNHTTVFFNATNFVTPLFSEPIRRFCRNYLKCEHIGDHPSLSSAVIVNFSTQDTFALKNIYGIVPIYVIKEVDESNIIRY